MAELLRDFIAKEFPPISMVIGRGILAKKGKLFIGGAPKIGKSFLVLNMAINLAQGHPLFEAFYKKDKPVFPVYEPNRVLYIENEIGEQKLQERCRQILGERDASQLPLFIKSRDMGMRMDTPEGRDLLMGEIKEVHPDVVIIDPLAQFHLQDENSSQHMGAVMRVGDRWIETFGTSLIYIHHTGHPNPDNPRRGGAKLRGSTAIFAAADSVMMLDRQSAMSVKEPIYRVDFELRHGEAMEPIYLKKRLNGLIEYQGENITLTNDEVRYIKSPYDEL